MLSGTQDMVIAAGVENMAIVPIDANASVLERMGTRREGTGWIERYGEQEISQFRGAQLIAEKWDISRERMEEFAVESHRRAARATDEGRFTSQIAPLEGLDRDEGIRPDANVEKMSTLPPLREGYALTAAVSSQVSVGAAALLVASEDAVRTHGLTPVAKVTTLSVVGEDPVLMLTGPIPATRDALRRAGLTIDDIDLFECNEAFASVVLAWAHETGADLDAHERQRRRHRHGPPARRDGRDPRDQAGPRAAAHRRRARSADDVRGRRPVQRDDHRDGLVELRDRTAVVTGAGGGIGRALVAALAEAGARVVATDRDAPQAEGAAESRALDVTDAQATAALLDEVGPVDVYLANAGVAIGTDPVETPDAVWDTALDVNLRAHITAAKLLLPGWLERGEGYFVSTTSAAGLLTQIGSAPYAVSKHAAVAFAEWLSVTYGERGSG